MCRRRIAEEVVHIAENLLVSTYEKHSEEILLAMAQGMDRQHIRQRSAGGEIRNLSVGVASDVLDGAVACGLLVETLYRHDREQLVDTPAVGQRLEDGEVAEVLVSQQFIETAELIGHMLHRLCNSINLVADAPVHRFYLGTRLEVDHSVGEHVETVLANLLGVVPVLKHRLRIEVVPNLIEVLNELMISGLSLKLLRHFGQRGGTEDVQDKNGMMRSQTASALGDDVRVRNIILVGDVGESVYAVVDVLLDGIVDRTLVVRRPCAVIIDTESASAIDEFDIVSHLPEVGIVLSGLGQSRLYAPDFRYLTAYMKVYQAEAVVQSHLVEAVEGIEKLRWRESELRRVAAALGPFA